MGKWSIRFSMLLTLMILIVSYSHTVRLYADIGYGTYEAFTITAFIEGIFLLSTVTLARNRIAKRKSGWPLRCGFAYGAFHVLFSNLHHSADLTDLFDSGIAGWVLGISILVGLIIIELIVSYGVSENNRTDDGQDTEQSDSVRELNEDKTSGTKRTDDVRSPVADIEKGSGRTVSTDGQANEVTDSVRENTQSDIAQLEVSEQEETDSVVKCSGSMPPAVLHTDNQTATNGLTSGHADVSEEIDGGVSGQHPGSAQTDDQEEYNERTADGQGELGYPPDTTDGQRTDSQEAERTDSGRDADGVRTNDGQRTAKTKRTESDDGQRSAGRTSGETKKRKGAKVPEEVVEQVYLRIVEDTGKVPSIRGLMKAAGSSKHMADKVISRFKEQNKAV